MPRPRKKPDYDAGKLMEQLIQEIVDAYLYPQELLSDESGRTPLNVLAEEFSLSSLKVRKLLVTAGVYDTPICRRVQELYAVGKTVKEIQHLTGLSAASVSGYLPYRKTVYKLEDRTVLAERLQRYRERKLAVQKVMELLMYGTEEEVIEAVWNAVCWFEGYSFETVQGLRFHYKVGGKELFFSRKEKSVTRATVDKAVKTVLELQRQRKEISGPKKLNCFGASYLYPVFMRIGLISKTQFKSSTLEYNYHWQK